MLQVRIRDDGHGIGAEVLQAGGREGHFGLLGLRERAEKIRAQLKIWSKSGAGTEVDVRVPAQVAYRRPPTTPRLTGAVAALRQSAASYLALPFRRRKNETS